jgi:hypothetical protein
VVSCAYLSVIHWEPHVWIDDDENITNVGLSGARVCASKRRGMLAMIRECANISSDKTCHNDVKG